MGIYGKIAELHSKLETVTKDKKGYNYKYADLNACHAVVDPLLESLGLVWVTRPECTNDGRAGVHYQLIDLESNDAISGDLLLPMADLDPQKAGSCITYARRYALGAIGLLTEEDDDGAAATKKYKRANPKADAKKFITEDEMTKLVGLCREIADERFPDNSELADKDFMEIGKSAATAFKVGRMGALPAGSYGQVEAWIVERRFE